MAQNKAGKSTTAVTTNHVYAVITLLIVIAALLVYALAANGVFAGGKFH